MPIQYSPISQAQYAAARAASSVASQIARPLPVVPTSTLNDRTPVAQPTPLKEGQFIWGEPANFSWGNASQNVESGPQVNTSWSFNWPEYGLDDPTADDPQQQDDPEGESEALPPVVHEWQEVGRVEKTVRINGPDGAYVDFARIEKVVFELPPSSDGRLQFLLLSFSNP